MGDKMKKKKVLFIASTGGHLTELMQLKPLFKEYDYHLVTEKTSVNLALKKEYGKKIDYVIAGTKDHKFTYIFKLFFNCATSSLGLSIKPYSTNIGSVLPVSL